MTSREWRQRSQTWRQRRAWKSSSRDSHRRSSGVKRETPWWNGSGGPCSAHGTLTDDSTTVAAAPRHARSVAAAAQHAHSVATAARAAPTICYATAAYG